MKTGIFNEGACGIEQVIFLGNITYKATAAVKLANALPKGVKLTRIVVDVKTAFNAATTNTLKVGSKTTADKFAGTADSTLGTAGQYIKQSFKDVADADCEVYATYAQSGTAATAGEADIYAYVAKVEV